jgi:hypothetical protein
LEELRSDVLVKTDEAQREVIVDAMGLFQAPPGTVDGIVSAEGTDEERLCIYQMWMADGFVMDGVDESVSVVWVHEIYPKKHLSVDFWVIFTHRYGPGLTIEDARELGHRRWDVENEGFKKFNQKITSKHLYAHDTTAMTAIELLLCLIFILLQVFLHQVWERVRQAYRGMKLTRQFVIREIRKTMEGSVSSRSHEEAYPPSHGESVPGG